MVFVTLCLIALVDLRLFFFPPENVNQEWMLFIFLAFVPLLALLGIRGAIAAVPGEAGLARLVCGANLAFLGMVGLRKALLSVPDVPVWLLALVFLAEVRLFVAAMVNVVLSLALFVMDRANRPYAVAAFFTGLAGLQLFPLDEARNLYGLAVLLLAGCFVYGLLWGAVVQKLFRRRG